MRFYLLSVTLLALIIPLLKLPKLLATPHDPLVTEVITLGAVSVNSSSANPEWYQELFWWVYLSISICFLIKLIASLYKMVGLKAQSRCEKFNDMEIYKVPKVNGSFTFFHWIFLDEDIDPHHQDYQAILTHEKAHAVLGHTYDLLFTELFKVCFWWLPTAWFLNKEIRKIHEYQADAYALKRCLTEQYSSILISSTLKSNGLSLASSFHDGLILKRLNAMKQRAKKVSPWKIGVISVLCTLLVVIFACTEDVNTKNLESGGEVFEVVEQQPEFKGGMEAFYHYLGNEIKYPLQARRMGIEGKVQVQFVVEKDGAISNVQAIEGIGAGCDKEAVRVVENADPFTPGKQLGMPVRVQMVLPVTFKLNHEKTNPDNSTQGMVILDEVSNNMSLQVTADYSDGQWSGVVYDEMGEGLPGANIMLEGTQMGTTSNMDGSFTLNSDRPNDLVVSFVGFQTVRIPVR